MDSNDIEFLFQLFHYGSRYFTSRFDRIDHLEKLGYIKHGTATSLTEAGIDFVEKIVQFADEKSKK